MTMYYKAVRPDGSDFRTGTVQWAPPAGHEGEWIVRHPTATEHLSVSTVATDCTGMGWPCRLLTVEPVGDVALSTELPHERTGVAFRVTGERPAHEALGPQGVYVAALIERARHLTPDEARAITPVWAARWNARWNAARNAARDTAEDSMRRSIRSAARDAAWDAARSAAWNAAWNAARNAARDAVGDAAGDVAGDAAGVLVVRDLISADQYDALTRTWRTAIGPIHPDDPELQRNGRVLRILQGFADDHELCRAGRGTNGGDKR